MQLEHTRIQDKVFEACASNFLGRRNPFIVWENRLLTLGKHDTHVKIKYNNSVTAMSISNV